MTQNGQERGRRSPKLALTMGDVAGVGPEVVAQACVSPQLRSICQPTVVGNAKVLQRALSLIGCGQDVLVVRDIEHDHWENPDAICCWDPAEIDASGIAAGEVAADAGRAAYEYLAAAATAALQGSIDGITTAPLSKAALHAAGLIYPGHTEILAEMCEVTDFAMMLYLPPGESLPNPHGLGVTHVTLHTSIRSVPDLLTSLAIQEKISLIDSFLRSLECQEPRIAVCALNPHGGESGIFGDEEIEVITPAVSASREAGLDVAGPLPADTLLRRATQGEFDGVVAMYHDQGHIALKLVGFDRAVNVTLGLPIVRTSPSHGTAFDIAWQGQANADGMKEAVRVAARLAQKRISE